MKLNQNTCPKLNKPRSDLLEATLLSERCRAKLWENWGKCKQTWPVQALRRLPWAAMTNGHLHPWGSGATDPPHRPMAGDHSVHYAVELEKLFGWGWWTDLFTKSFCALRSWWKRIPVSFSEGKRWLSRYSFSLLFLLQFGLGCQMRLTEPKNVRLLSSSFSFPAEPAVWSRARLSVPSSSSIKSDSNIYVSMTWKGSYLPQHCLEIFSACYILVILCTEASELCLWNF